LDKQNSWYFGAQAGQPMFMIMTLLSFVAWCSFPFFIFLFGLVLKAGLSGIPMWVDCSLRSMFLDLFLARIIEKQATQKTSRTKMEMSGALARGLTPTSYLIEKNLVSVV